MKTTTLSNFSNQNYASQKPIWKPKANQHWNNSDRNKRRYFNPDYWQKRYTKFVQVTKNSPSRWGSGKKLHLDEVSTEGSRKSSEEFSKGTNSSNKNMNSVFSANSSDNSPKKM